MQWSYFCFKLSGEGGGGGDGGATATPSKWRAASFGSLRALQRAGRDGASGDDRVSARSAPAPTPSPTAAPTAAAPNEEDYGVGLAATE